MTAPAPSRPRRAALLLAAAAAAALGAAASLAQDAPAGGGSPLDEMDMGLLQRNLLKIYVCEKESGINAKSLDALKASLEDAGDPNRPTLKRTSAEEEQILLKREKDISHYLLMEKTDAVQMIHIVDRILGTDAAPAGVSRAERDLLEKTVEIIEIPRGTEMRRAGEILSGVIGCPVRVETVETEINRAFLTMGPTTVGAILEKICADSPYFWKFENGGIVLRHNNLRGGAQPHREDLGGGDDEEGGK